jgi:hypothetical protein
MMARRHEFLRGLLGIVLAAAGCSFGSMGLGEESSGTAATGTGSGTTGSGVASEGSSPTGGETGSGEGTNGMTGTGTTPTTGTSISSTGDTTGAVDPSTGAVGTTGVDPSTTTNVDPSTSTGCVEMSFYQDGDKDGYGDPGKVEMGCEAPAGYVADNTDCNDGDDQSNPGASEVCGGGDNDCDGLTDEYNPPANVDCGGCKMFAREATLYHFCGANKNWDDASAACEGRKAVLAKDADQALHDWLSARLTEIKASGGTWWLGLRTPDGDHANFTWRDGSKLGAFQPWALGAPYFVPNSDCVRVTTPDLGARWVDAGCGDKRPFICEGPLP